MARTSRASSSASSSSSSSSSFSSSSEDLNILLSRAREAAAAAGVGGKKPEGEGGLGEGIDLDEFLDDEEGDEEGEEEIVRVGSKKRRRGDERVSKSQSLYNPIITDGKKIISNEDVKEVKLQGGGSSLKLLGTTVKGKGKEKEIKDENPELKYMEKELDRNWGTMPRERMSKKQYKKSLPSTAGSSWFDLPAPTLTPELKKELQALKLAKAMDPKRHYKKGDEGKDGTGVGEYFALGHILPSTQHPTTHLSSQETNPKRSSTFLNSLLSDTEGRSYVKRKFEDDIQRVRMKGGKKTFKRSGGKGGWMEGGGGGGRKRKRD